MLPQTLTIQVELSPAGKAWEAAERALVVGALKACFGNKVWAARALGISIRTLRNKMDRFSLDEWRGRSPTALADLAYMPLEKSGCP